MSDAIATAPAARVIVPAVAAASFQHERAFGALVESVKTAGHADPNTKWSVLCGYMAQRLNPTAGKPTAKMLDAAAIVLLARNADAQAVPAGVAQRTREQETMYASARQVWSRILKAAGVEPTEKRGATSKPKAEPTAPTAVRKTTAQETAADPVAQGERAKLPKIRKPVEFAHYGHGAAATVLSALDNSKGAEDPRVRALAVAQRDAWAVLLADLVAESSNG